MKRHALVWSVLVLVATACASSDTTPTTSPATTSTAATTTTSVATTSTTAAPASTTSFEATTTEAGLRLPADACDQLDTAELAAVLGVEAVEPGSPSQTSADGMFATCRFGVTTTPGFGSAFDVMLFAPSDTGAYDDALAQLADTDGVSVPNLGVRSLYVATGYAPLLLVEYENGTAAFAYAESDTVYIAASSDVALASVFDRVIGPFLTGL